jgi:hypothetical protein
MHQDRSDLLPLPSHGECPAVGQRAGSPDAAHVAKGTVQMLPYKEYACSLIGARKRRQSDGHHNTSRMQTEASAMACTDHCV